MDLSIEVYGAWEEKQLEKYKDLIEVKEVNEALKESESALDIGIGKAWLWRYLHKKGYEYRDIVGVDVSKKATEPEKEHVKYIYSSNPKIKKKFDLIVAFDSIHLIEYKDRLPSHLKRKGYFIQSLPMKFSHEALDHGKLKTVEEGKIGRREKDYFILQKKDR